VAHLSLSLLGPFQVTLNGKPVAGFRSDKERALLIYLAVEADTPHRRASLVGLLWPDCTESVARNNLRQALFRLHQAIGEPAASPPFPADHPCEHPIQPQQRLLAGCGRVHHAPISLPSTSPPPPGDLPALHGTLATGH